MCGASDRSTECSQLPRIVPWSSLQEQQVPENRVETENKLERESLGQGGKFLRDSTPEAGARCQMKGEKEARGTATPASFCGNGTKQIAARPSDNYVRSALRVCVSWPSA